MERLHDTLHYMIHKPVPEKELDDLARQIRDVVYSMERLGFVHGDLHTGNIGYIKVRPLREGVLFWLAPESPFGLCGCCSVP